MVVLGVAVVAFGFTSLTGGSVSPAELTSASIVAVSGSAPSSAAPATEPVPSTTVAVDEPEQAVGRFCLVVPQDATGNLTLFEAEYQSPADTRTWWPAGRY